MNVQKVSDIDAKGLYSWVVVCAYCRVCTMKVRARNREDAVEGACDKRWAVTPDDDLICPLCKKG